MGRSRAARAFWRGAAESLAGPASYNVSGFSDSNYYKSANGTGPLVGGTKFAMVKLLSLGTANVQEIPLCHGDGGVSHTWGWYWRLYDANNQYHRLQSVRFVGSSGGAAYLSPAFDFVAGDVGKYFCIFDTVDASNVLHLDVNGSEIGSGTQIGEFSPAAPTETDASIGLYIGRFQTAATLSCNRFAFVSILSTPTVMTGAQRRAYAETVMAQSANIRFPQLPGENFRYLASDLAADSSSWPEQHGGAALARQGSVTVGPL